MRCCAHAGRYECRAWTSGPSRCLAWLMLQICISWRGGGWGGGRGQGQAWTSVPKRCCLRAIWLPPSHCSCSTPPRALAAAAAAAAAAAKLPAAAPTPLARGGAARSGAGTRIALACLLRWHAPDRMFACPSAFSCAPPYVPRRWRSWCTAGGPCLTTHPPATHPSCTPSR